MVVSKGRMDGISCDWENYTLCEDLSGLLLGDALDLLEDPAGGVGNRFDSVKATVNDQLNIALGEARHALR